MPRAKVFDYDETLIKAMQVFWSQGYQATTMQDLLAEMAINPGSLYHTFGDKHRLFLAALERYEQTIRARLFAELDSSASAREGLRRFFMAFVARVEQPGRPIGCLLTNSVAELAAHDPAVAAITDAHLQRLEDKFYQVLLRAQQQQEISGQRDLRALARFLTMSVHGLNIVSKMSANREVVRASVDIVLATI
jgi:TetR/AcrR family transcriptional repressor of nem operon